MTRVIRNRRAMRADGDTAYRARCMSCARVRVRASLCCDARANSPTMPSRRDDARDPERSSGPAGIVRVEEASRAAIRLTCPAVSLARRRPGEP
jgi:hypothetical protein